MYHAGGPLVKLVSSKLSQGEIRDVFLPAQAWGQGLTYQGGGRTACGQGCPGLPFHSVV